MNYCLSTIIFESMHMPEYDNNIESDKEFHHAVNVYTIVNCYCSNNCVSFFFWLHSLHLDNTSKRGLSGGIGKHSSIDKGSLQWGHDG